MKRFFVFSLIFALAALVLAISWWAPGFSDLYIKWVFPLWINSYGRLTALSPISVGEIMLYVGVFLVALAVVALVFGFFFLLFGKKGLFKFGAGLTRVILDIATVVFLIQVLNCFVLYHSTPLSPVSKEQKESYQASAEDLLELREILVKRANELAPLFIRDADGNILYSGDMAADAVEALGKASSIFSQLEGFCSKPKPLLKSDFFSQQYIAGYYFPFSLEANYNDIMYIANKPSTMCHELAHLKGFIREDEANFVSYLSCIGSGNDFFEYSGVLMALSYVNGEVYKLLDADPTLYDRITKKTDLVIHDCVFLTDETWALVEQDAILDTEVVAQASDDFLNANLTANGVEEGTASYSAVVKMLLQYYFA